MWAATRAELAPAALREAALGQAIVQRSARYTTDRDTLASPRPDGDGDLAARALFFTVADAAKIWIPLGELLGRGLIPTGAPLRVVDLGAGAGAMSLGLAGFLARHMPSVRAEILAIDRDRRALAILAAAAAKLAPPLAGTVAVSTRVATLGGAVPGPADLVLAGSVLNELSPAAALDLVRAAMDALTPDGAVILIEPALRQVARRLHQLRDTVIAEGIAAVFAPCTRTVAPCPALADDRDWCHEDRPADLPPQLSRLARRTNLRTGGLKFSYLVLRRDPAALVPAPGSDRQALRVVSQPRRKKGALEMFACGDCGRIAVRRLARHRSSENGAIDRARRGDVVVIENRSTPAARLDLGANDRVFRLTPAAMGSE